MEEDGEVGKLNIIFKDKNNKKLAIEVALGNQIKETLESLNEYFQVSADNGVRLYRNDNKTGLLDENKTFLEERVNAEDTLFGFVQELIYSINVTNTHNNKTAKLVVDKKRKLRDLRGDLSRAVGINGQNFEFHLEQVSGNDSRPLPEDRTFEDLNIPPGGKLYVSEINVGGAQYLCFIYVLSMSVSVINLKGQ